VQDIIQDHDPVVLEVSTEVSQIFDARNKVFKVFRNDLYYFKVLKQVVTLMKINLKT